MALLFEFNDYGELSQQKAETLLRPISPQLCKCLLDAWYEWRTKIDPVSRDKLSARSRASVVSDFARENAKQSLGTTDEVEPNDDLGFFKLYVKNSAVLRFKRLDENGLARNLRTQQQIDYYSGVPIPGLRPGTRMTVGYVLNPEETEIADVRITRQLGRDRLIWWFSILGDADVRGMPAPAPLSPSPSAVKVRPIIEKSKEA